MFFLFILEYRRCTPKPFQRIPSNMCLPTASLYNTFYKTVLYIAQLKTIRDDQSALERKREKKTFKNDIRINYSQNIDKL